MIRAAIFDMDGTILDSLADMTAALNYAMERFGHRHDFQPELVKIFFGSAARVAVERALAAEEGEESEERLLEIGRGPGGRSCRELRRAEEAERIQEVYKPYYKLHCREKTRPYPGIPELLSGLREAGLRTAVVSNKPDEAVQKLCDELFPGLFHFSLGEKNGLRRKPEADMVFSCMEALGIRPEEAVYVGDTEIDIETAQNAGLRCIAVGWGFRSEALLRREGAREIVWSAEELRGLLLP